MRSLPQDEEDITQDRGQMDDTKLQEEDMQEHEMCQCQDSHSEVPGAEPDVNEDAAVSSEDNQESERTRHSRTCCGIFCSNAVKVLKESPLTLT